MDSSCSPVPAWLALYPHCGFQDPDPACRPGSNPAGVKGECGEGRLLALWWASMHFQALSPVKTRFSSLFSVSRTLACTSSSMTLTVPPSPALYPGMGDLANPPLFLSN